MTFRALGVVALLLAFTTGAYAGGVDWSSYIEKPGESRPLVKTTPEPKRAQSATAAPTAKKASSKRVARSAKAKTSKAKMKTRAKPNRRR